MSLPPNFSYASTIVFLIAHGTTLSCHNPRISFTAQQENFDIMCAQKEQPPTHKREEDNDHKPRRYKGAISAKVRSAYLTRLMRALDAPSFDPFALILLMDPESLPSYIHSLGSDSPTKTTHIPTTHIPTRTHIPTSVLIRAAYENYANAGTLTDFVAFPMATEPGLNGWELDEIDLGSGGVWDFIEEDVREDKVCRMMCGREGYAMAVDFLGEDPEEADEFSDWDDEEEKEGEVDGDGDEEMTDVEEEEDDESMLKYDRCAWEDEEDD